MASTLPVVPQAVNAMDRTLQSVTALPYVMTTFTAPNDSIKVDEFFKDTVEALNTYAVPITCVLGIIGDVTSFCIIVFTYFWYQTCSQYLAALTFFDTLFLISQLISSLMTFFPTLASAPGYCSTMVYLSYVCSFLSAWFVVLMMLERYLVVCHPFRPTLFSHKRKALITITVLILIALCLYCHSFFTTITQHGHCTVDVKYYHFMVTFTYVDSFLTFIVPFFIIVLCNLRIIFAVRNFRKRHYLMNYSIFRSQRSNKILSLAQVRSTKMLLWVSSVFVILYLPSYAIRLHGMILGQISGARLDTETQRRLLIAQQLCQYLYYVNFAVDFIVFFVSSSIFRRNVGRCCRRRCLI